MEGLKYCTLSSFYSFILVVNLTIKPTTSYNLTNSQQLNIYLIPNFIPSGIKAGNPFFGANPL